MRTLPLILIGLTLAGCGGSSASPAQAPLSKADYVQQANALCTTATTTLKGITPPKSAAELGPYLTKSLSAAQTATTGLKQLQPPAADAKDLAAKFTDPLAKQVDAVKVLIPQYEQAAKAADPKAAVAAIPRPPITPPDQAFVTGYGMTACATLSTSK